MAMGLRSYIDLLTLLHPSTKFVWGRDWVGFYFDVCIHPLFIHPNFTIISVDSQMKSVSRQVIIR